MPNVVRQDIVQIMFETNIKELTKLNKEVDDLRKTLLGGLGDESFEDLKKNADKAGDGLDDVKKNADKVKASLKAMADKGATAAFNGLKKIAGISFKALAVGIGAAATGIGALVAKSTQAFADFEQLKGGVETLFGAGGMTLEEYAKSVNKSTSEARGQYDKLISAQNAVLTNANNGYKDAGLSANEYMETVTSFSASLISSLGNDTQKAADYAHTAIVDMSDNANKMGTDMGMIQNAYQGFAKQNYTMLDNLKLGYGGTKTEMERLIKDAAKLDKSVDANSMSFANIVKAIHAVQDNMGITGTTQKEAEKTVTGSLNAMKASWGNLLAAIGSGENLDQCFENMIASAETFAGNLMPVVERALSGMGTVIEKLAPVVAKKLPGILEDVLPSLISAAGTLIGALVKELPGIIKARIPAVKEAAAQIVKALYEAFTGKEMSDDAFEGIKSAIDGLISTAKVAIPVIFGLATAFKAYKFGKGVVSGIKTFAGSIKNIASKASGGLGSKLSQTATGMTQTGNAAKTNSTKMLSAAKAFLMIAAAVVLVAVGFAILSYSAIALANAGWPAIAVMFGLVVALAALGFGMMLMLKSLSTVSATVMPAALAMLVLGGAVILIAAGFTLLAYAATMVASAGGGAIAVLFGLIAAIAGLMVLMAVLGPYLTAGAVGMLAFGAAILMVGAGALLASVGIAIIAQQLPIISQYGMQGALAIVALGAALVVFAVGATAAGIAMLPLSLGLAAVTLALLPLTVAMTALMAVFLVLAPKALTFAVALKTVESIAKNSSTKMVKSITKSLKKIVSAIRKTDLESAGKQMLNGLIRGMNAKRKSAISTARSIAQAINREYAKVQKIKSPSRVWDDFGSYQIQGDINGMKRNIPQLKSTVQEVGEASIPYAGKYTPENSMSTYSSTRRTEYNTYAPQFNFTASGTSDDRAMLRKMKRMFEQSWADMMAGYESKMPRTQEV